MCFAANSIILMRSPLTNHDISLHFALIIVNHPLHDMRVISFFPVISPCTFYSGRLMNASFICPSLIRVTNTNSDLKKELTLMWSYCRDLYVRKHEKDDVSYYAI